MKTEEDLIKATQEFFNSIVNYANRNHSEWSPHWYFNGEIPNYRGWAEANIPQ